MKKWIILLVLLVWPGLACALPDTPYDPSLMLWYPRLTQPQQQVFDLAYAAAAKGETVVELPRDTLYHDAKEAMEALILDAPELCALDTEYSVLYFQDTPHLAWRIELKYVLPAEYQSMLVERAADMAARAYGDEFQREWILHDMLCRQVVYDLEAEHSHSAWGALMDGRAVCDGYAEAMTLLLRLSYIESGVAVGRRASEGDPDVYHAWNMVRVDSAYTWLDPTNNDQSKLCYFYFNLTDDWLERSYIPLSSLMPEQPLPACTDPSVNWYVKNYRYVAQGDMELHIFNNFRNMVREGSVFTLRFELERDYVAFRDSLSDWCRWYNDNAPPEDRASGRLLSYLCDAQKCITVELEQ